jgi:hypothetical protein
MHLVVIPSLTAPWAAPVATITASDGHTSPGLE